MERRQVIKAGGKVVRRCYGGDLNSTVWSDADVSREVIRLRKCGSMAYAEYDDDPLTNCYVEVL